MKYAKYLVSIMAMLLPFSISVLAQEVKQEAKPEAAAQAVTTEATPTAEVKQAAEPQHEHAMGKEKRVVATVNADGVQRVEITGGEYYFDPNYIVVKVNVPAEFVVKKEPGFVPHDLVVKAPEAGIDFAIDLKKEPQTIKFTPTKTGKFEMVCDKRFLFFKSHKDRGMEGVIEVVP